MLKFLVVAFVLSLASPLLADTGTTFGDLFYLPNSSEYLFDNKTTMGRGEFTVNRINSTTGAMTDTFKNKRKLVKMDQKLAYSATDYFQMGMGIGFVFRDHLENISRQGPNGTSRNQNGELKNSASFTDPSIFAKYRLMNTKDHGFIFDINASVLVDLDETKLYRAKRGAIDANGNTTGVGNQKRGGSQFKVGADFGKNFGVFEAAIFGEYIYSMKARTQRLAVDSSAVNAPGNVNFFEDKKHEYVLGVKSLTHLYTRWLLGLGANVTFNDESNVSGRYANNDLYIEQSEDYMTTELNTEIRYVYTRDLYIAFGYAYSMNGDRDTKYFMNANHSYTEKTEDDNSNHAGSFQLVCKF